MFVSDYDLNGPFILIHSSAQKPGSFIHLVVAVLFNFLVRHGLLILGNHIRVRQLVLRHLPTPTRAHRQTGGQSRNGACLSFTCNMK